MGIDLRIPIGLMFAIMGFLLCGYGLFGNQAIYSRSLGINVNLRWGALLLAFGLVMMGLAKWASYRRARQPGSPPPPTGDGQ